MPLKKVSVRVKAPLASSLAMETAASAVDAPDLPTGSQDMANHGSMIHFLIYVLRADSEMAVLFPALVQPSGRRISVYDVFGECLAYATNEHGGYRFNATEGREGDEFVRTASDNMRHLFTVLEARPDVLSFTWGEMHKAIVHYLHKYATRVPLEALPEKEAFMHECEDILYEALYACSCVSGFHSEIALKVDNMDKDWIGRVLQICRALKAEMNHIEPLLPRLSPFEEYRSTPSLSPCTSPDAAKLLHINKEKEEKEEKEEKDEKEKDKEVLGVAMEIVDAAATSGLPQEGKPKKRKIMGSKVVRAAVA